MATQKPPSPRVRIADRLDQIDIRVSKISHEEETLDQRLERLATEKANLLAEKTSLSREMDGLTR